MYSAYRAATTALELIPGPWQPEPAPTGAVDGLIHGASAGEVKAARALLETLSEHWPKQCWALSTATAAGMTAGADFRLPRDLPAVTEQLLEGLGARSLLLVEAELWPNLLAEARRREISVAVVGARVSARSAARMSRIGAPARQLLQGVCAFAAASQRDAERLLALGVPKERVEVTGWLKWPANRENHLVDRLTAEQPFDAARPLLVLGSVHPGEATALARLLSGSALAPGRANWLLVGRHQRNRARLLREAERLCPAGSYSVDCRMGVLRSWYRRAAAVFVGGGLQGRGCHDLLEALSVDLRPLCFLQRGDPGGVGEVLAEAGLALTLDPTKSVTALAHLATERIPGAYAEVQTQHDGRQHSLDFLSSRGVLPQ